MTYPGTVRTTGTTVSLYRAYKIEAPSAVVFLLKRSKDSSIINAGCSRIYALVLRFTRNLRQHMNSTIPSVGVTRECTE